MRLLILMLLTLLVSESYGQRNKRGNDCDFPTDSTMILADSDSQEVKKGGSRILQSQALRLCEGSMIMLWGSAEFHARGSVLGTLQIRVIDSEGNTIAEPNVRTHGRRGSPEIRDQMSIFHPFKVREAGTYTVQLVASNSGGSIGDAKFLFDRFQIHVFPDE